MQRALILVRPSELPVLKQSIGNGLMSFAGEFVTSVEEAYSCLETQEYELLVATVGSRDDPHGRVVRSCDRSHPEMSRLVVTDDRKARDRAPAHLYVAAGNEREFRAAITGAIRWHERLGHARLGDLVAGAKKLPSLPDVYTKIQTELASDDPSMTRVGEIVQEDPAIAVTVLRVVNSAQFGLRREVGDIVQATAMLGARTVSSLVLASAMYSTTALDKKLVAQMWQDALTVGNLARRIAQDARLGRTDIEEAHLAGLMHDVGDIVLLQNWPKQFVAIDMDDRAASERELFGATHADIGGYLATLWELPVGAVDAIANHHTPAQGRMPRHMSPTTAVHVARCYVDSGGDIDTADLDVDHLAEAGVTRKTEGWFGMLASADAA